MNNQPFRRSTPIKLGRSFGRSIDTLSLMAQFNDMENKPPMPAYYSRGKGGKQSTGTNHKHMAYVRQQRKLRNKK